MPVPGRKAKPEGQARNRNKPTHDWTEVPDVPFKGAPKLPAKMPNGLPWPTWTKRWWRVVSSMPHCALWSDADWEFAFDTAAQQMLGARGGERFVGFIHIGTPTAVIEDRDRPDIGKLVTRWQG